MLLGWGHQVALGSLWDVGCAALAHGSGTRCRGSCCWRGFAGERGDREVGLDLDGVYPGSWDEEEPALRLRSTMGVCTGAAFLICLGCFGCFGCLGCSDCCTAVVTSDSACGLLRKKRRHRCFRCSPSPLLLLLLVLQLLPSLTLLLLLLLQL